MLVRYLNITFVSIFHLKIKSETQNILKILDYFHTHNPQLSKNPSANSIPKQHRARPNPQGIRPINVHRRIITTSQHVKRRDTKICRQISDVSANHVGPISETIQSCHYLDRSIHKNPATNNNNKNPC